MLTIRMLSQGLAGPGFDDAAQVVERMGAIQAQDIRAAKWAVGLRMRTPSLEAVRQALDTGRILRLHVMRPTWHYIPAKDVKWMAALSAKSMFAGILSWAKQYGVREEDYRRNKPGVEAELDGRHLTVQEITERLNAKGTGIDETTVKLYLGLAEAEGTVCSGAEKAGKHTYALICQRVPDAAELTREEALAELARRYFRSHGPAAPEDFLWWSGLGVRDARNAVASLGQEILSDRYNGREMLVHASSPGLTEDAGPGSKGILRFLPPFDEYLISDKNRLDCIREAHTQHAYNNFGIFQPVILHNGRITGNWRKGPKKGTFDTTFFPGCRPAAQKLIEKAGKEYMLFHEKR